MECQGLKVLETGFILRKSEFMIVYCIYDTEFYGFLSYNISSYILKVVRCNGCANATFTRPQMESQGLKVLETGFILKKSEFMMFYCIYDTAFYGFLGVSISSYICWKLSRARDAQTQRFRDHKWKVMI